MLLSSLDKRLQRKKRFNDMKPAVEKELVPCRTMGQHLREAWKRRGRGRNISIFLMVAMIAMLLLGYPMLYDRGDPKHFALALTVFFVFFFAVIVRALSEVFDILRAHLRESRQVYRTTLGEAEFARNLGHRVAKHREEP